MRAWTCPSIAAGSIAIAIGCGGMVGGSGDSSGVPSGGDRSDEGAGELGGDDAQGTDAAVIHDVVSSDASTTLVPCVDGYPAFMMSIDPASRVQKLVSDGVHLFVAQQIAPQIWMTEVIGGGDRRGIFSDPGSWSSVWPMLPRDGGIYFLRPKIPMGDLQWSDGVGNRVVASNVEGVAFWHDMLVGDAQDAPRSILGVDVDTGATTTIGTVGAADVYDFLVTDRMAHAIIVTGTSPTSFADLRISLDDPTSRSTIAVPIEGGSTLAGPDAVYFEREYDDVLRLGDTDDAPAPMPKVGTLARPLFAEAQWLYLSTGDVTTRSSVVRVSVDGSDRRETIASGLVGTVDAIGADTSCVFIAMTTGEIFRVRKPTL